MLFIITLLSLLALPSDKKRFPLLSKLDEKDNKDGFDHRYDKKVINLATKVLDQSNIYKNQLSQCSSILNRNRYIIF